MPLTRSDVEMVLGDLGDQLVARILAMGVTRADLDEAARQLEGGTDGDETERDGLVHELCRLLAADADDEIWPDY